MRSAISAPADAHPLPAAAIVRFGPAGLRSPLQNRTAVIALGSKSMSDAELIGPCPSAVYVAGEALFTRFDRAQRQCWIGNCVAIGGRVRRADGCVKVH